MDLIRQIALVVEEKTTGFDPLLESASIQIDGYTSEQIALHCALMSEAKLIVTIDTTYLGSRHKEFSIARLTWAGCDFLDAARDQKTWKSTMTKVRGKVSSVTFDVLLSLLKSEAGTLLGMG